MADTASVIALQALLEWMAIDLQGSGDRDGFLDPFEAIGVLLFRRIDHTIIDGFLKPLEITVLWNIVPSEISQQFGKVEVGPLPVEMFLQIWMVLEVIHREFFGYVVTIRFEELFYKPDFILADFSGYVSLVGRQANEAAAEASSMVPGFTVLFYDSRGWEILYDAEIKSLHVFSQFALQRDLFFPNLQQITFIPL